MDGSSSSQPARNLSLFDCICIGTNGIIGSGIYLLIAPLASRAGYASVLGVLTCGTLCILIGLCFAELGGMFDRNGGPYAMAADGYLPTRLIGLNRYNTPGAAIVVATGLAALLALLLRYGLLVDVSNVALFGQYIPTCLAVLVLRYRMPDARRVYRLPAGPLIPLAGAGFSVALLMIARPKQDEWIFSAEVLLAGLLVWAASAFVRGPAVPAAASANRADAP